MTTRRAWPAEVEQYRKSAVRHARQCVTAIIVARRFIEGNRASESLLHIVSFQNHVRHIQLDMEQARVEARRWGHGANDTRAKVRRIAHEMSIECEVLKREIREGDLASALLDLAEQEGRAIEIQVLLVSIAVALAV